MASKNIITKTKIYTHGGSKANNINAEQQLRRSVMSCLLWENEFYEDGENIADRIKSLVSILRPEIVAPIAIEAREKMKLRHIPLLIIREMARKGGNIVGDTLARVIQRPDEICEYLAIYGDEKLSSQTKRGLALAFNKFNEYQFAKYNRLDKKIKLRDALLVAHPKPKDDIQSVIFKKILENKLETPDTWEVALSGGDDKKETFTRLMQENKLGDLAFLRNLRNMDEAKINKQIIIQYGDNRKWERVLPFRFMAAARMVPQLESSIESWMITCMDKISKLPGKTILIVDISGSMGCALSKNSDLNRLDTALALSILVREKCEDVRIYATAGNDSARTHATALVPSRRGFSLADIIKSQNSTLGGGGIFLVQCLDFVYEKENTADRIIVITDEQDCDNKLNPDKANAFGNKNYMINIASAQNGIGYNKKWLHINGWSEAVLDYIIEYEKTELQTV